jgi:hypothetical protein
MLRGPLLTLFLHPLGLCLDVLPIDPPKQLVVGEVIQVQAFVILKKYK